ncbi:hypothetical protein Rhe02_93780 [Rhizocola hellebori]|uniref:CBM2 domain-containing protein n=1 Tax=Rhizocola hellebori TaxID=1392758 RepID=A0A8J3QIL3_9ACTN|nr:cellulose binding domain-containing protein [Rhizocola hellebori]GIH11311.1 hypothetical protein Rhe02_93780 [Rhizocola hellebori]
MGFSLIQRAHRLAAACAVTLAAGLVVVPAGIASAAPACKVTYTKTWDNGSGFGATLLIENLGDPLTAWSLTYAWPGAQRVSNGWSAIWSQTGVNVTARNASWNGNLATNASVVIGFNGTYTGTNIDPVSFALNDTVCTGQPPVSPELELTTLTVTVPEGGTAGYGVRLTARPSGPVTVTSTAGAGDTSITVASGSALTFTPANWQTSQAVTLAAAEDADVSAGMRQISVSAPGMAPLTVTATESENDVCVCPPLVTPTVLNVPEGGSATFTMRLTAAPTGNIIVTITAGGGGDPDLTVCSGATLIFTPVNWQIPQNVTICAAEDADTVNGSRTFIFGFVGATPIAVTATEIDNDLLSSKMDNA